MKNSLLFYQEVRQAKESGKTDVEIMQFDHIIPDVGELSLDAGYLYNNCAEMYYMLESIWANQPR